MPGAFFLTRAFVRTLPVTLNGVRRVSRGWGRAASGGLNQPTSLEFIGNTACVVTLGGEIWKTDGVLESALRHRALSNWVPDDRLLRGR